MGLLTCRIARSRFDPEEHRPRCHHPFRTNAEAGASRVSLDTIAFAREYRRRMADELVLIVDDNAKNLKLARDVLRHDGFRTLEAATAREAVSLATEQLPDLVLMDIRLPDMDGTDALRLLKEDERTAPIPVVALTSMDLDQEQFTADGFDGCLTKPISVTDFGHQIRAWLR